MSESAFAYDFGWRQRSHYVFPSGAPVAGFAYQIADALRILLVDGIEAR